MVEPATDTMTEGTQIDITVTRGFSHLLDKCLNSIETSVSSGDLEPAAGRYARHYSTVCSCAAPVYLASGNSVKAKKLFSVAINFARASDSHDRRFMRLLCAFSKSCRRVGDLTTAHEALESALEIAEGICGYTSEETLKIVSQLKAVSEGIDMEQNNRQRAVVASTGSKLNNVDPSNSEPSNTGSNNIDRSTSSSSRTKGGMAAFLFRPRSRSQKSHDAKRVKANDSIVKPSSPPPEYPGIGIDLASQTPKLVSELPALISFEVPYIPSTGFTVGETNESIDPGLALEIFLLNPAIFIPRAGGVAPGIQGTLRLKIKKGEEIANIHLTLQA
ncbi:hypothetical protein NW762_004570, partial [Fusarium torreyae]